MKKYVIAALILICSVSAKAQFSNTDTLRAFINRWIRNSAVEAFQNLRLNTAMIGMTNFLDSAYGSQVRNFEAVNDTTARLVTMSYDTFTVALRGNGITALRRRPGTDSVEYLKNGTGWTFAYKDSVGGGSANLQATTDNGNTTTNNIFIKASTAIPSTRNKIYFYGNSNTVGYLLDSTTERFATLVSKMFGATERNFGLSGSTMEKRSPVDPFGAINMLDRLSEIRFKGDSGLNIVVAYGGNDGRQNTANYTPANFKTDYKVFIDSAIARGWSASDIVLVSPFYTPDKVYRADSAFYGFASAATQARNLSFGAKVLELATEYGTKYVDGYAATYCAPKNYLFQYDSLHFNYQGHMAIAASIMQSLNLIQKKNQSLAVHGNVEFDTVTIKSPVIATNNFFPLVLNDSGQVSVTPNGLIYNIPDIANPILYRVQGGNIAMAGKIIAGGANYASQLEDFIAQTGFYGTSHIGDIFGNKNTNVVRLRRNSEDYMTFSGDHAVTLTNLATAGGTYSLAGGYFSNAGGAHSVALGPFANASGGNSIALEAGVSSGQFSFASQSGTSSGQYGFSHGQLSIASGTESMALIRGEARGNFSSSIGLGTMAKSYGQFTWGVYPDTANVNSASAFDASDPLVIFGNGTATSARNNALLIRKSGKGEVDAAWYYNNGKVAISTAAADSNKITDLKTVKKVVNDSLTANLANYSRTLKGTVNWTPGVVAAGSSTSTTLTVTGAAVGDPVTVSKLAGYSNGEIYDAFVSATNTVTIRVHNVSTGSANYSSAADYNCVVLKY